MKYAEFKRVYLDKAKEQLKELTSNQSDVMATLKTGAANAKIIETNAPENTNKHKDEKILAALQATMVETRTKGEIIYPPSLVIPKSIANTHSMLNIHKAINTRTM